MRDHIELALPGALTVHTSFGPVLLAGGIAPQSVPWLDPLDGIWSARIAATTTLQTPTIALQLQAESAPRFVVSDLANATRDLALRAGLALRPLPWLVLQPALSFEDHDSRARDEGVAVDTVRFGGVMQRGFFDAPLLEVEFMPGLMAYVASSVACRVNVGRRFGGLSVVEQRHGLGLLLYF